MSIYKGNNIISGGSIDTHFVRRPAWNQAVAISAEQLYAGYTAPSDGMFVCSGVMPTKDSSAHKIITVNGIAIVMGQYPSATEYSYGSTSCPVSKGDLIKANTNKSWSDETRYFIPFEDSTVSESDIEVVTPEYIRNQNILSDWEEAALSTNANLPTIMQYDGFISGKLFTNSTGMATLYINGTAFAMMATVTKVHTHYRFDIPVKKGDSIYYVPNGSDMDSLFARYYKLRDYTGR